MERKQLKDDNGKVIIDYDAFYARRARNDKIFRLAIIAALVGYFLYKSYGLPWT